MRKIALIAALAFSGLPFAFAQTKPPATASAPAKHHRRTKAHQRAKKANTGAADRAMPGEK